MPLGGILEPDGSLRRLGALVDEVRETLDVDAITIAVRVNGSERLLVSTGDGGVRETTGSISLGRVSAGPTRLASGPGILQAFECASLVGFVPTVYFGAPFYKRQRKLTGGIAAWSREPRRWSAIDGSMLRRLAAAFANQVDSAIRA